MSTPPANIRRHFLAWHRPLLPQAVDWLATGWTGDGPLDLSQVLVIVPTSQSGRRLRAALAERAAVHGQAVFAPRVLTPEGLVSHELGPTVASRLEALLAWTEVLRTIDLEEYRAVFPIDPAARDFAWALQLGHGFSRLQQTLAEAGLRLVDVPDKVGPEFVEATRWRQLAVLDTLHAARLAGISRREPQAARIAEAFCPSAAPPAFERLVLLAVPDPQPLALVRLVAFAATRPIEVVVFAPETEADAFDEWGRPRPAAWEQRVLAVGNFGQRVHLCADPAAQSMLVAGLAGQYAAPEGALAVGVADPELVPLLESELRRVERDAFVPEGRLLRHEALFKLLECLAALARDSSFSTIEELARCPDFFAYLRAQFPGEFSVGSWLAGLDELRGRHLPADLSAAIEYAPRLVKFAELVPGLEAMHRIRRQLGGGEFAERVAATLQEIFAARQLEPGSADDTRLREAATAWTGILRECADAAALFGPLERGNAWELALRLLGEVRRTEEKPAGALELQGWLELLWEDAPHLVVAGMNDGRVPDAVVEDAFLPESLRQQLGLKTNAARLARDAYILQAIAGCRQEQPVAADSPADGSAWIGRLDLVLGKATAAGDPLRPSRLLLRCPDSELPDRINFLFRTPPPLAASTAWTRAWKLTPRGLPPPPRVAVTALRRYLECPFRFYLRTVLRMEAIDPLKTELDAFDFGLLCHAALEQIGLDPALRECREPDVLRAGLGRHFDHAVRDRYGRDLALPLLVQVESARQRLGRLAELQAAERAAGWVIAHIERPFEIEIAGLTVRGKIDRIDRHEVTGDVRVIDYKTSDAAISPPDAHLRALRPGERLADWARHDLGGRPRAWCDLQLPLYLRALAPEFPGPISCGYFNLPKAAGATMLSIWTGYTPDLHDAALRCAEGACAAIRAGEFWPPNEAVPAERDEWAALFHHGCAASVSWPPAADGNVPMPPTRVPVPA